MDEDLRLSAENLKSIRSLESRLLPIKPALKAIARSLSEVDAFLGRYATLSHCAPQSCASIQTALGGLARQVQAYNDNVEFLLNKTTSTGHSTSDTLNIRFQTTSQDQSGSMCSLARAAQEDSVAIRVITLVTLFYLPFSFIAVSRCKLPRRTCADRGQAIMGMNLVVFDTQSRNLVISSQFWLFFLISLPLTALTLLFWKWMMWRHQRVRSTTSAAEGLRGKRRILSMV